MAAPQDFRYRLNRAGVVFVVGIKEALQSDTKRSQALISEMKVITTLRFLATGNMQYYNSDGMGVSYSTMSSHW